MPAVCAQAATSACSDFRFGESANPIAADRAEQARLDYLALGDWHGCKQIESNVWYSGTHEPERFVNNNPGYALLVEIDAPGASAQVTQLETACHRWFLLEQTLAVATDIDHLQQKLQALPDHSVCRLKISGSIILADEQRLLCLWQEQHARLRVLQYDADNLQLQPTDDDITALQAEGANGMEELLRQQQQELDFQQQRLQQLERRANALVLLKQQLQDQRDQLTRKLQAPLQKHLNHYLNLLFPGAEIEVNDQLIPTGFRRNGEQGNLVDLSFGTREQMGLIARLAYADLLSEAGQPTLIILVDSLVHSDRTRLEQMQRILFDAQNRHQILLFSCHPHNWQNLGCKTFDIEQLSAATTRQ
ncbi:hypothetical protein CBP31_06370 [Oceanisphaera profunda]|uniref:GTP-binding protein n=1 Tax=Oceanisphaera profunda TaxID=1416627 RepID=A0A1Y0D5D3_9GAMM|nr:hypothetical protein CBP31_06370 [Oceanisphaera profunda]